MITLASKADELIWLARKMKFVREAANNHGLRVEAIQKWGGGEAGQSWCCYWATMLLDIVFEGNSPIPRQGSCDVVLEQARKEGWLKNDPQVGDLYLLLNSPNDAHHVGIVVGLLDATRFQSLSGNTNTSGSSNGDGVYEKPQTIVPGKVVFVRYPR